MKTYMQIKKHLSENNRKCQIATIALFCNKKDINTINNIKDSLDILVIRQYRYL